ncbi:membrane fusion protein HasE /membrane fusion protein AprE [Raoultella sp. BIGb0138]|uniref:HlyD family type I secretion periplasmic adaptor subunit n=1 Tax=Raoultella sp. BIGb0138 TaxID=2485115 RepID=UPI0010515E94|nr:HlyD family type I secretion periplasmic adaptor subunit [Raoultella sp. BIGb0138]TCW13540.1 membrane fusion protein HasE /membrane fusion protein AprE [Raoultella sp. BIGb0138]
MKALTLAEQLAGYEATFNERSYLRWGVWLVIVGFGGFLCWASFAPLDRGVPVAGSVVVTGNRKAVQHPGGGVIAQLRVRDGEKVQAGQVLAVMNTVATQTRRDALQSQLRSLQLQMARWRAERTGENDLALQPELIAARDEPEVVEQLALQRQLLINRRAALRSELAAIDEGVAGTQALLSGMESLLNSKQQQKRLLNEQLSGIRGLAAKGYVARNQLLSMEGQLASVEGEIAQTHGSIGRLRRQTIELRLQAQQRRDEYSKEVNTQLADGQAQIAALKNQLEKAQADLQDTQIRAPVAGTVVGMAVFTEGGVIQAGQQLMEIVPEDSPMEVEARVPVELIDKVHLALPVELLFSAFDQSTTPRVAGEVTMVGADRLVDEQTGKPYYALRVKVTRDGMDKLQGLTIRPGMPVEGFIRTGERTLMNYLLKPLTDRLHLALTES